MLCVWLKVNDLAILYLDNQTESQIHIQNNKMKLQKMRNKIMATMELTAKGARVSNHLQINSFIHLQ